MKSANKYFTLVEVLLALGVCAIGICSIMVLFPVGASASRDAAALTYSANIAEELLHLKQYEILEILKNDPVTGKPVNQWNLLLIQQESGSGGESNKYFIPEREGEDFLKNRANLFVGENATELREKVRNILVNWDPLSDEVKDFSSEIYSLKDSDPTHLYCGNIFLMVAKRGELANVNDENIDFRCIGVLWQEEIAGVPKEKGRKLKLEVSWPAEIPYSQRQKSVFGLNLFNN